MRAALEGIARQLDTASGSTEARPRERSTVGVELGHVAQQGHALVGAAPHRVGQMSVAPQMSEHLAHGRAEHRVRADLEEGIESLGDRRFECRLQEHRLAGVAPPVFGVVRGGVESHAVRGRIERLARSVARHAAERRHELLAQRLELGAVIRHLDRNTALKDPARVERLGRAREHTRGARECQ